MPTIEHPMTSHRNQKDIQVTPQPSREAVVMMPEDEELIRRKMAEEKKAIEQRIIEDKQEKLLEDPVIENEIKRKRAVENLVLFNKVHARQVKVGPVTFTMKLLNARDSDEVYQEVLKLSAEDQVTKTGRMLLAASLFEADGVELEVAYDGPVEIESRLLRRYHVISGWPAPLINNLTKAYQKLVREAEEEFSFDFLAD